jgi:hypothetical protein
MLTNTKEVLEAKADASAQANEVITDIQSDLQSFIYDLTDSINSIKKPTKRRKKDIAYLLELLDIPNNDINKYTKTNTADKLAVRIYNYFISKRFTTGVLKQSKLRRKLLKVIEDYFPEMFSSDQETRLNFYEDLEELDFSASLVKRAAELQTQLTELVTKSNSRLRRTNYSSVRMTVNEHDTEGRNLVDEVKSDLSLNLNEEKSSIRICEEQIVTAVGIITELNHDLFMQKKIRNRLLHPRSPSRSADVEVNAVAGKTGLDKSPEAEAKEVADYIRNELINRRTEFLRQLAAAIQDYETTQGDNITPDRRKNVADLKEFTNAPKLITVDKIAAQIYDYLHNKLYKTGPLNNSNLREKIIEILKDFCPTLTTKHYKMKEQNDLIVDKFENAFRVIAAANSTIKVFSTLKTYSETRVQTTEAIITRIANNGNERVGPSLEKNSLEEKKSADIIKSQLSDNRINIIHFKKQFDSQRSIRFMSSMPTKLAKPKKITNSTTREEPVSLNPFQV